MQGTGLRAIKTFTGIIHTGCLPAVAHLAQRHCVRFPHSGSKRRLRVVREKSRAMVQYGTNRCSIVRPIHDRAAGAEHRFSNPSQCTGPVPVRNESIPTEWTDHPVSRPRACPASPQCGGVAALLLDYVRFSKKTPDQSQG